MYHHELKQYEHWLVIEAGSNVPYFLTNCEAVTNFINSNHHRTYIHGQRRACGLFGLDKYNYSGDNIINNFLNTIGVKIFIVSPNWFKNIESIQDIYRIFDATP